MNRSIFQIWLKDMSILLCRFKKFLVSFLKNLTQKVKTRNFFNLFFLFTVVLLIIADSTYYSCSNIKIIVNQKPILRDLVYNGIRFKAHNSINDYAAKNSFEAFMHHCFNTANLNFSISKYYNNNNGILRCFEKKSPLSHPNINFGLFGDGFINYQLSHHKMIDFNLFSTNDIKNNEVDQFISNLVNIYDKNLSILNLNHNCLLHNDQYLTLNSELVLGETKNNLKVQNFCNENKLGIIDKTKKYLKL